MGDRVSAIPDGLNFGGFAQYRVTSEKEFQLLAPGIDPVYALGEPQKCVMTVLRATAPEPGDFGVVLGVGPMGMWCVQALSGKSLAGLIAIDIDDSKLAMAKQFGATHVINNGTFVTKPLVTHEFKLSKINTAFDMLEHKPTGFNKGIVIPD